MEARDLSALDAFAYAEAGGADRGRSGAGRWMAHMLSGNFAAAWRESDKIRARGLAGPHCFWDGSPVEGRRLIVRCLHGFGDALQFLRYAPRLRAQAAELIIETPPRLSELAKGLDGIDRVVSWGDRAPETPVAWDCQLEVMELPYFFRTELNELPIATNYLKVPEDAIEQAARAMGPPVARRVGLVWTAGEWNRTRSIPFATCQEILNTRDVEFWNLQGGPAADDWRRLPRQANLRDARLCGEGLVALAATISHLDLVITVDTMAAHLAGALGKPAWLLLERAADWRWMIGRTDSPWYPALRLFRQSVQGNWRDVVHSVCESLERWKTDGGTR